MMRRPTAHFVFTLLTAPPIWDGNERRLEVRVRTSAGSANPFVPLTPSPPLGIGRWYALSAAALSANHGNAVARLEILQIKSADLAERLRSPEALVEGFLERTTP